MMNTYAIQASLKRLWNLLIAVYMESGIQTLLFGKWHFLHLTRIDNEDWQSWMRYDMLMQWKMALLTAIWKVELKHLHLKTRIWNYQHLAPQIPMNNVYPQLGKKIIFALVHLFHILEIILHQNSHCYQTQSGSLKQKIGQ